MWVTATIQKGRIVSWEKKEIWNGIEEMTGSAEPDMPAYRRQGRKNERDPDVDCQLTFIILRNPALPWKEEPIIFLSALRPASRTERQSNR